MPMTRQRIPHPLNTLLLRIRPISIQLQTRQLAQMLLNRLCQDVNRARVDFPELKLERVQVTVGTLCESGGE